MARTTEAITPSSWRKVIAIATLASVIVSIVILAFTWPTKAMEAKNLGSKPSSSNRRPPAKTPNGRSKNAKPTARSSSPKVRHPKS